MLSCPCTICISIHEFTGNWVSSLLHFCILLTTVELHFRLFLRITPLQYTLLQMPQPLLPFLLLCLFSFTLAKVHPEANLTFMDYCHYFKYPVEKHFIETDDGYILTFFRIQKKNTTIQQGLKPVWVQHGLLDSSDSWIVNDEDKSPGLILANQGYDVWFGNSRGNKHSLDHIKYTHKDKQFWQFSFQHMGDYDIPAGFKYIYAKTGQKVSYIGHSQGTIQMHIALSKNNQVVESLLDKYFAFGPVTYVNHQTSKLMTMLANSNVLEWFEKHNINSFANSPNWYESKEGILFCAEFPHYCTDFLGLLSDTDPSIDNYDRMDVFVGHDPSGTSVMNMAHWRQIEKDGIFRAFNYGSAAANMAAYNQTTPPVWDPKNIRVKVRLYGGTYDKLADPQDLNAFWNNLSQGAKEYYKLYEKTGHCTFLLGIDTSPWMNHVLGVLGSSPQGHLTKG